MFIWWFCVEKRKIIRKIDQTQKALQEASEPSQAAAQQESLQHLQDQLAYINNYPMHWKYISLFPTSSKEADHEQTSKETQEEIFAKVMQIVRKKRDAKDKELMIDEQVMGDEEPKEKKSIESKISKGSGIASFFVET